MTMSDLRHLEHNVGDARIDLLADPALRDEHAAQVFECLLGRLPRGHALDGDRSIVFPARDGGSYGGLKIKGAGFRGGRVRRVSPARPQTPMMPSCSRPPRTSGGTDLD